MQNSEKLIVWKWWKWKWWSEWCDLVGRMWMNDDNWWIRVWSISVVKRYSCNRNFSWWWVGASEAHDSRTDGHPHLTLLRDRAHLLVQMSKIPMVNPKTLRLGWGKPEFALIEVHSSLMCTPDVVLPFLRGVEQTALEHSCYPQQPSNHSGR